MRKALLALAGLLAGLALADASDTKTFTVTVTGSESVTIDTGTASLTVDYSSSTCSTVDRFCAWYPTIIYETNYATNRKLVASATTSHPILSVVLEKQTAAAYANPFVPDWGSGSNPGSWAFTGSFLTLASTDSDVVLAIQNGKYAIAPILKLVFSTNPPAGTYTADVTFTIMAQ
ncbi:hypothetical protein [Thermus sp.]|jgi:hypothetical protein|uniref:hypothetical protein n=1 Tax=Thermus sp. TaxID=275 RepID=UPI00321FF8AD